MTLHPVFNDLLQVYEANSLGLVKLRVNQAVFECKIQVEVIRGIPMKLPVNQREKNKLRISYT